MKTVLTPFDRQSIGWSTKEEGNAASRNHNEIARKHFVKYCDTGKCVREQTGLKRGENWHEWPCIECTFNPYNMVENS